jgi:exodeoxyribonuclease V gamma subunit
LSYTSFDYTSAAAGMLQRLVDVYLQGLRKPVHFFPSSSWKFAAARFNPCKPQDRAGALRAAQSIWNGFTYSESDDLYYRHCFGNAHVLDEEFMELSEAVFRDIVKNGEDL